tara:strand:- start:241 stop:1050 length:810 start_codon:yes stop_codon:yes gene_type:complete
LLAIVFFCLIQGLTEFLPVSSQGHLIVYNQTYPISEFLGLTIHQAMIIAHFGSLFAVIFYYAQPVKNLFLSIKLLDRPDIDKNSFLLVNLIISTIPIVFLGYIASKFINYDGETIIIIIGITSIVFGIILLIVDGFCLRIKNQNSLDYFTSFLIGIFQCIAIIPGVSRSGSILTVMRFFGFQRKFAVKYSNLLSIPVITGAITFLIINAIDDTSGGLLFSFSSLLIFVMSFAFSIFFIFFLVSWVKRFSFLIFVVYRCLFGVWVLVTYL